MFLILMGLAFFNLVHEFGHILSAYLVNAEIEEIKFYPDPHITVSDKTTDNQLRVIVPAGSLLNCLYGVLLIILGKKRKQYGIFAAGFSIIEAEMLYWNINIPIKHGDAYRFYELFPSIGNYSHQLSILLSIVQILFGIYSIKSLYDIIKPDKPLFFDMRKELDNITKKAIKKYQLY